MLKHCTRFVGTGLLSGLSTLVLAAPTIELGENTTLDSSLTVNYTASMRTEKPDHEYLNSINNDDATRNFKRGSLINNRVSVFGELMLKHDNLGAVMRGSHFYDEVYHQRNDNDSPDTVNKTGRYNDFSRDTRKLSGSKARLLDAYVYGDFTVNDDQYLSLKAGRHLVAWGESLFWPNISQGQAPVDSTKFNVPGTEAKDAYLPVGQVSGSWSINEDLALLGFYQYKWEETQLNPVGDYFGSDTFGPGAEFYRLAPGIVSSLPDSAVVGYGGSVKPGDSGGPSYQLGYFDNIKLTGISFTTKAGDSVQFAGDLSYRDGAAVYLSNGAPARGQLWQGNLNAVYIIGPTFMAQQTTLMTEVVHQRIQGVDDLTITGGGAGTDGTFNKYVYDGQTRGSSLLGIGAYFDHPNVFNGWDLTTKATWTQNIDGSAYSGLGRAEKRLTLGGDFKYLGNFQLGLTYVAYLSSADLAQGRTMADRDYLSFNGKYTF